MSITVNGESQVPPGFRFHPTDEELLDYYLRKKVASEKVDLDVIREIDLNKLEPWDIQEKCRIGSTPQNDWYFFSHKDKKYPTGTRTNRATAVGFWKATGRDKIIYRSCLNRIGMRKTLVFYKGRAPNGQKSDWIMHEYRLDDNQELNPQSSVQGSSRSVGDQQVMAGQEEGWVVCRVFKKKNYCSNKAMDGPTTSSSSSIFAGGKNPMMANSSTGLDHILQYIVRSCKHETSHRVEIHNSTTESFRKYMFPMDIPNITLDEYTKLPALESPVQVNPMNLENYPGNYSYHQQNDLTGRNDWITLDRLVASHLNGQTDDGFSSFCSSSPTRLLIDSTQEYNNDDDNGGSGTGTYDGGADVDLWGAFNGDTRTFLKRRSNSKKSQN